MISFNDAFVQAYLDAQRRREEKEKAKEKEKEKDDLRLWSLLKGNAAAQESDNPIELYKGDNRLWDLLPADGGSWPRQADGPSRTMEYRPEGSDDDPQLWKRTMEDRFGWRDLPDKEKPITLLSANNAAPMRGFTRSPDGSGGEVGYQGSSSDGVSSGMEKAKGFFDAVLGGMKRIGEIGVEGAMDVGDLGIKEVPGALWDANIMANAARDKGVEYARNKGWGNKTWDNEADAYRHFRWNADMVRSLGSDKANTIATNHERANWLMDHGAIPGQSMTFDIPLSSLMDMHNNRVGREMASDPELGQRTPDELFNKALESGKLITTPDQTPGTYGFNRDWVFTKAINGEEIPFVKVTFDAKTGAFSFHPRN